MARVLHPNHAPIATSAHYRHSLSRHGMHEVSSLSPVGVPVQVHGVESVQYRVVIVGVDDGCSFQIVSIFFFF